MYGLPYQNGASVRTTVRHALALNAQIRMVPLGFCPRSMSMKRHKRLLPERVLPGGDRSVGAKPYHGSKCLSSTGYRTESDLISLSPLATIC